MRIGYVIWSLGLGGAEQVVMRLAVAMQKRGHQVFIFTLNEPGFFAKEMELANIPVIPMNKRGGIDFSVVGRLAQVFRDQRLDVVHTHLWGGNVWGRLAAHRAGVNRVVITEHNVDSWKKGYHFVIDRWLLNRTTDCIAVSHEVRQFYEAHDVAAGHWRVVYNGVDTRAALPRGRHAAYQALGISMNDRVVGLIGRLVPAKAPLVFLEAVKKASQEVATLKALVIGDGPLRQAAEAHAHRLGIQDRVIFTGLRSDVPVLLAGMDVLAFSSEREGLSMAMLESMAAGIPVVATRVGGTPELIESGRTGILVPAHQPQELADALIDLLKRPEHREAIRTAALDHVERHFSLDTMVSAHEAVYSGIQPTVRRICFVIDHLGLGGAQRQLVELAKRLSREHWEPIVIALSDSQRLIEPELIQAGVRVHLIPQRGKVDVKCLNRLTRLLKACRPEIVHTFLFTADTYGRIAAHRAGIKRVICAMRNTIDDMPAHYRLVNRWLTPWTSLVTVNADAIRPGLVREGGIPESKIRTVYNGIELLAAPLSNGTYRKEWNVPAQGIVIAMTARFSPQKDYRTFLEAAKRVLAQAPQAVFLVVGDGPQRDEIKRWINELGLVDAVRILGQRNDVRRLLDSVDICVLASHYEGCSNTLMEAMAAGKPVVATHVGGNPELVMEGVTGFLVPPKDPAVLADRIIQLLRDSSLRRQMGIQGRQHIEDSFTMDIAAQKTEALYQELLNSGGNQN